MGAAYFYHLTQRSELDTLRMLLGKSLEQGWKVVVRGTDKDRMEALDRSLWLGPEDGFLAHGMAGGLHDKVQPVLLTVNAETANEPNCVMSVQGAEVTADEVGAMARVCVLFDGNDEEALQRARGQWKALKDAGASAQYWSEASGRWEKKAET
jgi:DNA polymerase-3 subunit chi